MIQPGMLKYSYLAHLSQPAADRQIYRAIRRHRVCSIVELGVGYARRAQRMIAVASRFRPDAEIHYTGVDLFEGRPDDNPGITLKLAYTMLKRLDARVRVIPGDPFTALARKANSLTETDLLVIAADQDPDALSRAWPFVPRMIHGNSLVFLEQSDMDRGTSRFKRLERREIDELAGMVSGRSRLAA